MSRLLGFATFVSALLCALCLLVAFSCHHLFIEGTVNSQNQIIHEPWLAASARRYLAVACIFAIPPVVHLLRRGTQKFDANSN